MKILLSHAQKPVRELLSILLEGRFQAEVWEVSTSQEGIKILRDSNEKFDLIIADYAETGMKLLQFSFIKQMVVPFFFCITEKPKEDWLVKVADRIQWIQLNDLVGNLITALEAKFKDFPDTRPPELQYFKLRAPLLLHTNPLICDVFVKLSDIKYIKIARTGHDFSRLDLEYFTKKGLEYLFLRKDFVLPICQRLQPEVIKGLPVEIPKAPATVVIPPDDDVDRARRLEELKAKARALAGKREELLASKEGPPPKVTQNDEALQKKVQDILAARAAAAAPPPPAPPPLALTAAEKRAEAARLFEKDLGGALDSVQEMGQRLGFTEEVQKATRTHVLETIAAVKSTPRLSAILGQLRRDQEKYISSHSMLLAHVSCALATQIDWKSDTTFQKLTLAAFLHDISIKNQALARIDSLKELERERSRFTDTEVKTFKLHPIAGAEIAKNFKEIPPDVDAIIIQHHERPDGSGFPRGLNNIRIGPLATVFIVAHDLVDFLFETDSESLDSLDLDEFVQRNAKTYQFINFRKVLSAIPKLKG